MKRLLHISPNGLKCVAGETWKPDFSQGAACGAPDGGVIKPWMFAFSGGRDLDISRETQPTCPVCLVLLDQALERRRF